MLSYNAQLTGPLPNNVAYLPNIQHRMFLPGCDAWLLFPRSLAPKAPPMRCATASPSILFSPPYGCSVNLG